jgi:hypothetical protein
LGVEMELSYGAVEKIFFFQIHCFKNYKTMTAFAEHFSPSQFCALCLVAI